MNTDQLLINFAQELDFGSTLTQLQKLEVLTDLVNAIYTTQKGN
jgi:hypothetical protein